MSLIAQQSDDDREKSEGFWREFFLLKPDRATLNRILLDLSPDDLLQLQVRGYRKELWGSPI
jgi:hypothetical protein